MLPAAARLDEVPGLGPQGATGLIAEIGLDMSRFPTPDALVSWAGLAPVADQSGPRKGRGKKGQGNGYARRLCTLAADSAAGTATFLGERHRRLSSRPGGGGRRKANVAVGRSILIIVWHLLKDPQRPLPRPRAGPLRQARRRQPQDPRPHPPARSPRPRRHRDSPRGRRLNLTA